MTLQWRNGVSVDDPMFHISSPSDATDEKIHAPLDKADHLVASSMRESLRQWNIFQKERQPHTQRKRLQSRRLGFLMKFIKTRQALWRPLDATATITQTNNNKRVNEMLMAICLGRGVQPSEPIADSHTPAESAGSEDNTHAHTKTVNRWR